MGKRSFSIVTKEVNGRRISASRIACNACSCEGLAYDAAGRAKPNSAAQQYFEREGWVVGRTGRLDRCPRCRPSAISKPAEPILIKAEEIMAYTPREMSRDDRRIIFAKLDEVYLGEDKGYSAGWTDQKVATDLGIPRIWVETMREENFGSLKENEEIATVKKEVQELLAKTVYIYNGLVSLADYREEQAKKMKEMSKVMEGLEPKLNEMMRRFDRLK